MASRITPPSRVCASRNRKSVRRVREPIGLPILAEAFVGHHSYAPSRCYVSYRRYAPVLPMTRTRPPVDPLSPVSPGALEPPSVRRSPSEPLPKEEAEAHI